MASPANLSLDCKPHCYSMLPKSFGDQSLQPSSDQNQTHKLEDFLARLEEERLKIDAFKRELPLCMQLLTNAVETSRQRLQVHSNQEARLEEFIPLTLSSSEASEKATSLSDKTSWMTSAQLWSHKEETDIGLRCTSPKLALDKKQRNGGAFLPFSKERNLPSARSPNPDLALSNSADHKDTEEDMKQQCSDQTKGTAGNDNNSSQGQGAAANNNNSSNTNQSQRKARRCWSPDLHRRFVNALQMLGGSQVATPKQIREVMKVDGLTNDEVKSHLQKYRLHTRRASPSPGGGGQAPQLVVLGGIWVPSPNSGTPTLYATPAHYYTAAAANQMHHHVYDKSTPESEDDSAGERKDSEITLNFSN